MNRKRKKDGVEITENDLIEEDGKDEEEKGRSGRG